MEGFSAINGIAQDYFRSSCDILVGGYSSYIYEKWLQLICPGSKIPAICSIKFRPTCLRSFWNTARTALHVQTIQNLESGSDLWDCNNGLHYNSVPINQLFNTKINFLQLPTSKTTVKPLYFARDLISLISLVMEIREIKYPQNFKFYIDSNS